MLYLIGLGLSWKDLSLKALEAIQKCDEVYLENYTSVSDFSPEKLSKLIGKKIVLLDRKKTEEEMPFLKNSHAKDVGLMVYGDPLSATTHFEILGKCRKANIKCEIIHASSIFTAIAETGLSLYRFGKTASIPIPEKNFFPYSFFEVLKENLSISAHTLFLLDLKPAQNKFFTISEAIKILLEKKDAVFDENTFVIACARLCSDSQIIKAGKAKELLKADFGNPPYCLIVPAKLNFKEEEFLKHLDRSKT